MKNIGRIKKYLYVNIIFLFIFMSSAFPEAISRDKWRKIAALHGVPTRPALDIPSVYIFFDPNCPWSAKLYSNDIGGKLFGEVEAVWLPVHYMHPDSLGMAGTLLRGGNSALHHNFSSFDYEKRKGRSNTINPNEQEFNDIKRIDGVWRELSGALGTPVIVYKDKMGSFQMQLGFPPKAILEDIIKNMASAYLQNYDSTAR